MTRTTLTYDTYATVLTNPARRVGWLHENHRPAVLGVIWRASRGRLAVDEVEDAYQETAHDLLALLHRSELPHEQYLPMLECIAYRRAIDALRARGYRPITNAEWFLALFDASAARQTWSALVKRLGPDEREEFSRIVSELLTELPPRQQLVAGVYFDHLEDFGPRDTYQRLTEMVSEITGRPENVETIKSLWHTARATLSARLTRRGFSPLPDIEGPPGLDRTVTGPSDGQPHPTRGTR